MALQQGQFWPKNRSKYKGRADMIMYRSGWERRFMNFLDQSPSILEWSSEELVIQYYSPLDNKIHRYFPDFYAKVITADGKIKEFVYEIKPEAQTREPKVQTKKTKRYINEVCTWIINKAKWESADVYCKAKGWEFKVITEKHLGIK